MNYEEELNQIREEYRTAFELLRKPGKPFNNTLLNEQFNLVREQMRIVFAHFPKLRAKSTGEFSDEHLNQFMEQFRALDAKLLAVQKFAREDLDAHKEYLIKEILDGTLLDGLDFQELAEADTIRKRQAWHSLILPGMEELSGI